MQLVDAGLELPLHRMNTTKKETISRIQAVLESKQV